MENQIKDLIDNKIKQINIISSCEDETKKLAYLFAKHSDKTLVISLNGELGSGKTVFMNGFASYFKIENEVCSPTFTIVNEYSNNIYHFDVYRLEDENEFLNRIGDEYFEKGICIIEWADVIKNILPRRTIHIDIKKDENDKSKRIFNIWRK